METLDVRTVVYAPPETVFAVLRDFPGYANYSSYLEAVHRHGDGGVGTRYDLVLSWWTLSYTARSRVTAIDPPERIDWELVDLDASGYWLVEPVPAEGDHRDDASRITLHATYDPDSARDAGLGLPGFVSLDRVIDRIVPLAEREAERIVERVVADLEGERRPVELTVET